MSNRNKLDRAQTYEKVIKVELCNGHICKGLVANLNQHKVVVGDCEINISDIFDIRDDLGLTLNLEQPSLFHFDEKSSAFLRRSENDVSFLDLYKDTTFQIGGKGFPFVDLIRSGKLFGESNLVIGCLSDFFSFKQVCWEIKSKNKDTGDVVIWFKVVDEHGNKTCFIACYNEDIGNF